MITPKYFYFDVETTGTRYWKNGIHQIAILIEIENKIIHELNLKVQPYENALIEKEALDVSGVTMEDLKTYADFEDTFIHLTETLNRLVDRYDKTDKFFMVGYNCQGFDVPFLRSFFVQNAVTEKDRRYGNYFGSYFHNGSDDVMILAHNWLKYERHKMQNFKLGTVCRYVGIDFDEDEAHDALYDVKKTRELHQLIENSGKRHYDGND